MRVTEDALLLLRMGQEAGGRLDPERFKGRYGTSGTAFEECRKAGLVDASGYVTPIGEEALALWAE